MSHFSLIECIINNIEKGEKMNTKESLKKETAVNMSEYLYRGMRIDTREWVYGYLVVHNDGTVDNRVHSIFTGHSGFGFNEGLNFEWYEVIPETIGQFTGFFDKSCWDNLPEKERNIPLLEYKKETWQGRKIFGGDVLEVIMEDNKHYIMTVKIQDGKVMLFDQHGFGCWIGEFSDMIIVDDI